MSRKHSLNLQVLIRSRSNTSSPQRRGSNHYMHMLPDTKSQIETPSPASTLYSMCYQGIKLKWYSGKIVSQSNSISYYPFDNERRYYELTFNKKYLQIVTKKYLQYVVSEGREIQLNRTQKWLHTNNPIKEDSNNNKLWT